MKDTNFEFIIVGAGRGGTSLLSALLDYHSELEVASEYASAEYLMGRKGDNDKEKIMDARISSFIERCEKRAEETADKTWGNKITTEQIHALEDHNRYNPMHKKDVLEVFFNQYFKGYKVIFILRDGRACVASKVKRTGQPMETACKRWNYSVSVYDFLKNKNDNSVCIKFEDLLLSPKKVLGEICEFLGISFEENMLNGVSSQKLKPEYRNTGIIVEKAKVVDLEEQYLNLIKDGLRKCGYL